MPATGFSPIETAVDFIALGPALFPQVSVKVVAVVNAPVLLLPLAAGVAAPTPLSIAQVIVPPPVTPLQLRFVLAPLRTLEEVGMNDPMVTFERHMPAALLHVLPAAQVAVAVFVFSTVAPFFKLNAVEGYATQTWRPGDGWFAEVERSVPVLLSTSEGSAALAVVHVA
ncbi:MAG: hypothetical protein UY94_C0041G0008 [Parcubacteria group bacterium GW2011_GWA2_56_21]|nr:MAG: hypothetical protein UY94_C0041G0008 [Parcubacteria group bacterium GW2011_GWA2_56_21]